MALDIGEARIGIAICDPQEKIASPVCVLATSDVLSNARAFRTCIEDWEPELLLCGLPYTLSGEEGPQAAHIRDIAEQISAATGISHEFADERLSSSEAKRILREEGLTEKEMRGKVDMIAASLFLQAWLDAKAASEAVARESEDGQTD